MIMHLFFLSAPFIVKSSVTFSLSPALSFPPSKWLHESCGKATRCSLKGLFVLFSFSLSRGLFISLLQCNGLHFLH